MSIREPAEWTDTRGLWEKAAYVKGAPPRCGPPRLATDDRQASSEPSSPLRVRRTLRRSNHCCASDSARCTSRWQSMTCERGSGVNHCPPYANGGARESRVVIASIDAAAMRLPLRTSKVKDSLAVADRPRASGRAIRAGDARAEIACRTAARTGAGAHASEDNVIVAPQVAP